MAGIEHTLRSSPSWAHGIVHLIEGDRPNAGCWYRRAERDLPDDVEIESEIVALEAEIAGG